MARTSTNLHAICRYLWESGQYDEAISRLEWAETVCRDLIGLQTLEAARIYVNRGSVFSTLNRYDDAGPLFQKALDIRQKVLPEDDQLLANSHMQIGNWYTSLERVDDAIRSHRRAIDIRRGSPLTTPRLMAISYFNLSRSLLMGGRLDEAKRNLEQAQELEKGLLPSTEAPYYVTQLVHADNKSQVRRLLRSDTSPIL